MRLKGKVVAIDGTKNEVHVELVGQKVKGNLILTLAWGTDSGYGAPPAYGLLPPDLRSYRIGDEFDCQLERVKL